MCCDPSSDDRLDDAVALCPDCGNDVDADGDTVYAICSYSPDPCDTCGFQPCQDYLLRSYTK